MKDKIEQQLRLINTRIKRYTEMRDTIHQEIKRDCQTVDSCLNFLSGDLKQLKEIADKLEQLQDQKELLEYFLE